MRWRLDWTGIRRLPLGRKPQDDARGRLRPLLASHGRGAAAARTPLLERLTTTGVVRTDGTDEVVDAGPFATGERANLHYLLTDHLGDDLWRANKRGVSVTTTNAVYTGLLGQNGIAAQSCAVSDDAAHVTRSIAARLARATTPERNHPWPAAPSH